MEEDREAGMLLDKRLHSEQEDGENMRVNVAHSPARCIDKKIRAVHCPE